MLLKIKAFNPRKNVHVILKFNTVSEAIKRNKSLTDFEVIGRG